MAKQRASGKKPNFEVIKNALEAALERGAFPEGQVILEGHIAEIFNTSRAPVRRALAELHEEGKLFKFEGRGYKTDNSDIIHRQEIRPDTLGLDEKAQASAPSEPSIIDDAYKATKRSISIAMTFGQFRIRSENHSQHFGVSRTISREILGKLMDEGLVGKDNTGHWITGPLTARDVKQDYETRRLLEPYSLETCGPLIPMELLEQMKLRLEEALTKSPDNKDQRLLETIEADLHQRCHSFNQNKKIAKFINQSLTPLVVGLVFSDAVKASVEKPGIREHLAVIESLISGKYSDASEHLHNHLLNAEIRTLERMKSLSVIPEPSLPTYLVKIS
ncbi:GntR family transcriptional regulator [Marinobacter sp. NFXS11]|uniref:GntR family transcriptional regulator n=1 Tax=Marinobacter sp. NFXS11 TaxID=2818432 RepID=UPI0032E02809